ncbi:hypothetical protein U27_01548 [Candidatus Vecturithrix granuli]|uniref:Uncharacterized protein n=1 Tax=Vecturithrix granuli TaxID=1499967 RepID=A0A081CAP2_VECG1|nr:hypothetical protein U27_01548 [Candidatus Vecturithrix granuli]
MWRNCCVSNPSRDYSAFLQKLQISFHVQSSVSNPSRDYSAFLQSHCKWRCCLYTIVSNPSRDYSAFLLDEVINKYLALAAFQTLPGIIPRFYSFFPNLSRWKMGFVSNPSRDYSAFLRAEGLKNPLEFHLFQTLPGIIPRFYVKQFLVTGGSLLPFQTLPGIIPRFYFSYPFPPPQPFKRFQTLPGIIPRFYRMRLKNSNITRKKRFKPFQGLFRVSTNAESSVIA